MPKVIWDAAIVVASLSRFFAIGELPAREYLTTLDDADATLLWKCLRRLGWWIPDDQHSAQERLVWWLFRDDVTRFDFSDGTQRERIETPKERLDGAYGSMKSLANAATIPSHSCLSVANYVRGAIQVLEGNQLPLGPAVRQCGSPDDFQSDICSFIRFDGECLNDALNAAAEQLGLQPGKLHWQEATGHWFTTERRAFDDVRWLLTGWRDVLEREIKERRELPPGWEPRDTIWPNCPIKTIEVLREWLSSWLSDIHSARSNSWGSPELYLGDVQRELRNTRRAMREPWGISLPPQFDDNPASIIEAEKQLELLIDLLGTTASETPTPAPVATVTIPPVDPSKPVVNEKADNGKPWPPDDGWHFQTREAAFLGFAFEIGGKQFQTLKTLAEARRGLTIREIGNSVSPETEPLASTIRGYCSEVRTLLRQVFVVDQNEDGNAPIIVKGRGDDALWLLDSKTISHPAHFQR